MLVFFYLYWYGSLVENIFFFFFVLNENLKMKNIINIFIYMYFRFYILEKILSLRIKFFLENL